MLQSFVPLAPHSNIRRRGVARPAVGITGVLALALPLIVGCEGRLPLAPAAVSSPMSARAARAMAVDPAPGQTLSLAGELGPGALYAIDKPANWNGGLVVWLHGYTVDSAPIQLPQLGPLRDFFLSQGFAVAASSYSENGYAVAEGARESHQLAQVFSDLVAEPDRTFLVGVSLGGIIGLKLLETYDREYDGALLVSGVVGGSDKEVRYLGDVWVLFDYFFPNTLPGLFEERSGPFPTQQLVGKVTDPANAQAFQLFLAFARERGLPFASGTEAVQATMTALGFAWVGALDFFDRTHQHVLYDNSQSVYTAPGVPPAVADAVNAAIDRFEATPDAASYLRNYYEPDGNLAIPVITLHDQRDPLVPAFHEPILWNAALAQGRQDLLRQYESNSFGHVSAAVQGQIPARFMELVSWSQSLSASQARAGRAYRAERVTPVQIAR